MGCYNEFAHIYDELIHGDVDYRLWSEKILQICSENNVKKEAYLDLACGTGNLMVELAKSFHSIWGVDLSSEMLSEAENKVRSQGIKAKLICQDITELCLNRKFNLITSCLDATNYILEEEDLKNYFEGVYRHLEEGGLFIFDINSYYKLIEKIGKESFHYIDDNVAYIWENSIEEEIIGMFLTFFVKEGEKYIRFEEEHYERAYREEYIEETLQDIGFKMIGKLNNYEFKTVTKETERIVFVLKK